MKSSREISYSLSIFKERVETEEIKNEIAREGVQRMIDEPFGHASLLDVGSDGLENGRRESEVEETVGAAASTLVELHEGLVKHLKVASGVVRAGDVAVQLPEFFVLSSLLRRDLAKKRNLQFRN
jgi:hypothetical protein